MTQSQPNRSNKALKLNPWAPQEWPKQAGRQTAITQLMTAITWLMTAITWLMTAITWLMTAITWLMTQPQAAPS
jgi:hypothetical protein